MYRWQRPCTYYRPQRSWGKVMFLQVSVILLTGGCLPQCMLGYHTPREQTPTRSRHPPWKQTPPPPGSRCHPPPVQSMLGDTVNARAIRILLECNLVKYEVYFDNLNSLSASLSYKGTFLQIVTNNSKTI